MSAATLEKLVGQLAKTDDAQRLAATLSKLQKLGEAATPAAASVIPLLAGSCAEEARAALAVMIPEIVGRELVSALEDPERQAPVLDYLDDLRRDVGTVNYREPPIVAALEGVAVPALLALLERDGADHDVLVGVLGMLGRRDDRVFDKLVELLGDDDREVRLSAPAGLAFFGDRAVPHLEKLLARDAESARELRARSGLGGCVSAVCASLQQIQSRRSMRALQKAASSGRYGRLPGDVLSLTRTAFEKAELRAHIAWLEARSEARKVAANPVEKRPTAKKPAAKTSASKKATSTKKPAAGKSGRKSSSSAQK